MDRYGSLELSWSVGYNGSQLHFVTDNVLVYGCGNTLSFVKDNGEHIKSIPSEGSGVAALAVCHKTRSIAYAEATVHPNIFITDYPSCYRRCILEDGATLEFTSLSFSSDGNRLVSLSGVPDFEMTVWSCFHPRGLKIQSTSVGEGGSAVSVNPLNWRQIFLFGPSRITLWNLEHCDTENYLSPIEVEIPEKTDEVGMVTYPKNPPIDLTSYNAMNIWGDIQERGSGSNMGQFIPPDMSRVYFKQSYQDFIKIHQPLELKSFCWTPKQSIYIGCADGQLMVVEFDTGIVTMLVNPQPPLEETVALERKSIKTAYSLIQKGSLDCLLLSRRGLYTAGQNGCIQCFSVDELKLLDQVDVSKPIKHLSWSPSCSNIAIGCEDGAIFTANPLQLPPTLNLISNHLHSPLVGIDVLCPSSQQFVVTCRSDGTVQVWGTEHGTHVSLLNLNVECTSIACPLSCKLTAVGTVTGCLFMISMVDPAFPTIVEKKFMHTGPVIAIKHDRAGLFMASASAEGPVFFYDSRPSSKFAVLGYIDPPGNRLDLSLLGDRDSSGYAKAAILTENKGQRTITHFQLPNVALDETIPELYTDASKIFSDEFIQCYSVSITEKVSVLTLISCEDAFTILDTTFQLVQFTLSQTDQKELPLVARYEGHELNGGKVVGSFHEKWAASVAPDGKLLLRLVANPASVISAVPHLYQNGGCQGITFTHDSMSLITIGDSGSITCWKVSTQILEAMKYFERVMTSMNAQQTRENEILAAMTAYREDDPESTGVKKTWYMLTMEEAQKAEDEVYSDIKDTLREEIIALRDKVLEMITTNEELPDIEKLGRQEFILDSEDHQRMLAEEEKLIEGVREDIELSNLASMFFRYHIKRECWDEMAVKGKLIKAFQSGLEVSNYPMIGRSEAQLKQLERVKVLRAIETTEKKIRKEVSSELRQALCPTKHDHDIFDEEDLLGERKEKHSPPTEGEATGDPDDALLGSHRRLYGGEETLLADQFELHSRVYKNHQIVLLENCIYKVKVQFNKEFDDVMRLKVNEINRIKEKNVRVSKIISQLKLNEPLVQPSLNMDEEPEKFLEVEDSEVKIEKYISPEEKEKLEEAAKLEEKRRLEATGDNPRERALMMMMGGRLEANVEEDLFKDMPRPDFMSKDPAEMSEEEIRMTREFEKKEEAFLEEREKLKRALEAELRKLQASIVQGMEQFDEHLNKLFQLKIRTQMIIHQEELKILHLARSLFIEEEIKLRGEELNDILNEKKHQKVQVGTIITTARQIVEDAQARYEQLASEDKEMDRSFRKEFVDCEPYVDQLYKLFRRRPRGQKLKNVTSGGDGLVANSNSQNLFALGPSSTGGTKDAESLMADLDHISYMPEGMEQSLWERFVAHRHKKVESETKVKAMALDLAEMNSFLQKKQGEENRIQQESQTTYKEMKRLQEEKVIFDLNLEIQFLLKQGQVEVYMGNFIPDFSDSVLVHRSRIEELNSQIKTLGEAKLNSMLECKDFKRGIHMLEWEHRKMQMEADDLLEKGRDVQLMKVTRDLLQRLHEKDLFSKDIREKDTLEKTIEFNKKTLEKILCEKSKTLKELTKQVKSKSAENRELDEKLKELQVSLAERVHIENLAGVAPSEASHEKRMEAIIKRCKLVDTIKSQDEEYSVLKEEVERLRMRTFPALVQVD